MILAEGTALMAAGGYAAFSAREVAKRIGYSIGTIYNVFGSLDRLVLAINSRTFGLWAEAMRAHLAAADGDRIKALVDAYFDFAEAHPNLWMAIYDHRPPADTPLPADYLPRRAALLGLVEAEIARAVPGADSAALARSLVATVHGHCAFALSGTFALLGEPDPRGAALARVRETLSANALRASGDDRP